MNDAIYKSALKSACDYLFSSLDFSALRGSRVLIAGASGMIGRVLVDVFMELNNASSLNLFVCACGRSEGNLKAAFGERLDDQNFSTLVHDVNKPLADCGRFDYIIHAASNTHPVQYSSDPIGTITANVLGTMNLLDYAAARGAKRFVFLSSVEIYGEAREGQESFKESDLGWIDCNTVRAGYPEGKRVGEALCQAYGQKFGIDFVIPRVCRVYGPTMKSDDSKALSQFIKKAAADQDIVLKSDGSQFYSYIDVFDAATAILTILLKGRRGEAYNVSSKKSDITLKDLSQKLASFVGTKVVFELPSEAERKGFSKATRAVLDNSRLLELGWKELYDIDQGLELTLDAMREK